MSKILVVEDDNFLANAYRVKLSKEGFEVRLARDGDEAIASLSDFMPDLIILDLVMPGKDGFTTLSELKANNKWESIPVLIASNLGQKEDIERGLKLGATDFIVKSNLSMNDFINKINYLLKKN